MSANNNPSSTYKLFDLTTQDLSKLRITESLDKKHCYLQDQDNYYGGFIISKKKTVQTLCKIFIRQSPSQNKYVVQIEFRKENLKGETIISRGENIIVSINESVEILNFWKVISFLQKYNDLVDTGNFKKYYSVVTHENFNEYYEKKSNQEKLKSLLDLISKTELTDHDLKSILYNQRKKNLHAFYILLKNTIIEGECAQDRYRNKFAIKVSGSEAIWHHFLKTNSWILGLNTELRFIFDFYSEHSLGKENSKRAGSSKLDLLGTSYFTTLIELKTENTPIFKQEKTSKSRANTFDFSLDFIEAYSQILGQNDDVQSNRSKRIEREDGIGINRDIIRTLDPKCLLIIGCRNKQFYHDNTTENNLKTDTFERFRRDSRKIDIITYDELFERAFHIVNPETLPLDWFNISEDNFIKTYFS